jgi:hypothetical protein
MDLGRLPDLNTNEDLDLLLEIENPDTELPQDLTGVMLTFTLKSDLALADAEAELTKTATILDQVTNTGKALIQVTAAEMQIPAGVYWYSFNVVEPGGRKTMLSPDYQTVTVRQNPKSGL